MNRRNKKTDKETVLNNKGLTIIEVLISIAVGSVVIMMLMQMLAMNVTARQRFDYLNRMTNESYNISEEIRLNIFNLQPHSIEIITDNSNETIININHEYDITVGAGNIIIRDYSAAETNVLRYDKINETLAYDGQLLHSANVKVEAGSILSLISIDPTACAADPGLDICKQGILKLDLILTYELSGGNRLDPKQFVTTIIV